ncbi:MAG TPA: hypothetical protein PKK37_04710 [Candidatus Pacearchaeota archaeon]|nr:MAG: hypothetical protein YFSK_1670 [Candidatus Yanofskybacteria bacterium]HNR81711.1 hypothetical protein [Candidatus Pacearchaeota archaeon]
MAPSYQNSPFRQLFVAIICLCYCQCGHPCAKRDYLLDINYSGVW